MIGRQPSLLRVLNLHRTPEDKDRPCTAPQRIRTEGKLVWQKDDVALPPAGASVGKVQGHYRRSKKRALWRPAANHPNLARSFPRKLPFAAISPTDG